MASTLWVVPDAVPDEVTVADGKAGKPLAVTGTEAPAVSALDGKAGVLGSAGGAWLDEAAAAGSSGTAGVAPAVPEATWGGVADEAEIALREEEGRAGVAAVEVSGLEPAFGMADADGMAGIVEVLEPSGSFRSVAPLPDAAASEETGGSAEGSPAAACTAESMLVSMVKERRSPTSIFMMPNPVCR